MSRTGEFTNHVDDLLHLLEDVCGEITDVKKFDEFDLYECARNGDDKNFQRNLVFFGNINRRDFIKGTGRSVLQEASLYGQTKCVEIILKSCKDVDINQVSLLGKDTSLHFAIMNGHRDVAFLLLHHGANPNQQNKYGKCPLHYATDKNFASLLIAFGASVKGAPNQGNPIDRLLAQGHTKKSSELVRFLIEVEEAVDAKVVSDEIQEHKSKRRELEMKRQKEIEEVETKKKVKHRRQSMSNYLAWRTATK